MNRSDQLRFRFKLTVNLQRYIAPGCEEDRRDSVDSKRGIAVVDDCCFCFHIEEESLF